MRSHWCAFQHFANVFSVCSHHQGQGTFGPFGLRHWKGTTNIFWRYSVPRQQEISMPSLHCFIMHIWYHQGPIWGCGTRTSSCFKRFHHRVCPKAVRLSDVFSAVTFNTNYYPLFTLEAATSAAEMLQNHPIHPWGETHYTSGLEGIEACASWWLLRPEQPNISRASRDFVFCWSKAAITWAQGTACPAVHWDSRETHLCAPRFGTAVPIIWDVNMI